MKLEVTAEERPVENYDDRRADPRLPVEETAAIVTLGEGIGFRCSVLDLSISGCKLLTSKRFPGSAWDPVEVAFKLRGSSLHLRGVIQWIDGMQKAGVRFVEHTPRSRKDLSRVLAEIGKG